MRSYPESPRDHTGAGGRGNRRARVKAFVEARLALYAVAGPMLSVARARAIEHDPAAEAVAANRALLADQVRSQFAPELSGRSRSRADDLVAFVDSATSPEAWEIVHRAHGLSSRRIARLWTLAVTNVLDHHAGQGNAA